jgi:hypothetical protein
VRLQIIFAANAQAVEITKFAAFDQPFRFGGGEGLVERRLAVDIASLTFYPTDAAVSSIPYDSNFGNARLSLGCTPTQHSGHLHPRLAAAEGLRSITAASFLGFRL